MNLDKFTAKAMLSAIENGSSVEQVSDMYKSLFDNGNGPTPEQVTWFLTNKDKSVAINGTPYTGVVSSLNEATHGFYEGGRYPIYVKIDSTDNCGAAKGMMFEYEIDQLTLL